MATLAPVMAALTLVPAASGALSSWSYVAPLPLGRTAAGAVATGGKIYIVGGEGWHSSIYSLNTVYDPTTDTYTEAATMPGTRAGMGVALGSDGRIYVVGGHGSSGSNGTVYAYDPTTNRWARRASLPAGRTGLVAVRAGTRHAIYALGGYPSSTLHASAELDRYSVTTNTWSVKTKMPAGRWEPAVTTYKHNIYVFGGGTNGTSQGAFFTPTRTAWAYNTSTATWKKLQPMPTPEEGAVALTGSDGRLYVIGGGDDIPGPTGDTTVQAYNPATNTWTSGPSLEAPRAETAAAKLNGVLYVFGGVDQPFQGSGLSNMSSAEKATTS